MNPYTYARKNTGQKKTAPALQDQGIFKLCLDLIKSAVSSSVSTPVALAFVAFAAVSVGSTTLLAAEEIAKGENILSVAQAKMPTGKVLGEATYGTNQPVCKNKACLNYELLGQEDGNYQARIDYVLPSNYKTGAVRVNSWKFLDNISGTGSGTTGFDLEPGKNYTFILYGKVGRTLRVLNSLRLTMPEESEIIIDCAEDAKMCPDGSIVYRQIPACEFSSCSSVATSTPTPVPTKIPTTTPEIIACTQDAKMCPDGSYVGRTGKNCEFICPKPAPKIVCEYAAPPQNCSYVNGKNFDSATQCGKELVCVAPNIPTPVPSVTPVAINTAPDFSLPLVDNQTVLTSLGLGLSAVDAQGGPLTQRISWGDNVTDTQTVNSYPGASVFFPQVNHIYKQPGKLLLYVSVCDSQNICTTKYKNINIVLSTVLTPTPVPQTNLSVQAGVKINVAQSASGASAVASSEFSSNFSARGTIDGDVRGLKWEHDGGWNDATWDQPDTLDISFAGQKTISEVDVFTLQDNYGAPIQPDLNTTFSLYGIKDFKVQYWNGSAWQDIPGASVTGNTKVWNQFKFSSITTSKIRVLVTKALFGYSRIVEVQAY